MRGLSAYPASGFGYLSHTRELLVDTCRRIEEPLGRRLQAGQKANKQVAVFTSVGLDTLCRAACGLTHGLTGSWI